jgi:hypothetical protein
MELKEVLGEELFCQVSGRLGDRKLIVNDGSYIPKTKFDEVIGSKNDLKTQVSELTGQIETLKKSAKGNDEFTKIIEELQEKNNGWEIKYKNSLIENAVKLKATGEQAKDPNDLIKFIDMSKIELDDEGTITGLDDVFKALKGSKPYLFGENIPAGSGANPSGGGRKTELQQTEEELQEALKQGNTALVVSLRNKIFNLKKE